MRRPLIDSAIQLVAESPQRLFGKCTNVHLIRSEQERWCHLRNAADATFPVASTQKASKVIVENQTLGLLVFRGVCDDADLETQDVLVESSCGADNGAWIFAQGRPITRVAFARAETLYAISRSYMASGLVAERPGHGVACAFHRAGPVSRSRRALPRRARSTASARQPPGAPRLRAGFSRTTPSPMVRSRVSCETIQYRMRHLFYVPLIPGEQLNEQDRINASASDRYEIMSVHSTDPTGLSRYICICEKLPT